MRQRPFHLPPISTTLPLQGPVGLQTLPTDPSIRTEARGHGLRRGPSASGKPLYHIEQHREIKTHSEIPARGQRDHTELDLIIQTK